MKNICLATALLLLLGNTLSAQVQIDRPIDLNSATPGNARIMGIKEVSDAKDAVSAEVLQKGGLIYKQSAGGPNAYTLAISPAVTPVEGTVFHFKANIGNAAGGVTLNGIPVKKDVGNDLAAGDIQTGQLVTVAHDGTKFQLISRTTPANQVNADWNAVSGAAQILNKPTIPAAQVNSDWNAASGVSQILNKPTIPAPQIQSDWNQTNNTLADFIKNKPAVLTSEVDGVIGNEVTDATGSGGLTRTGSGTTGSPYTLGIATDGVTSTHIADGTVANADLASMGANTIKGSITGTGAPVDLTVAQAQNMLGISNTNSGDVTLSAIGASPNANGASLSGQVLNLQPANGSFGGVVTTGTQTFAGAKTFTGTVTMPSPFTLGSTSVTTTGTQLNYLNAATGTTGTNTTNLVYSTSPLFTTPRLASSSTAGQVWTATDVNGNGSFQAIPADNSWTKATTASTAPVKADNQYVTGNVGLGDFSGASSSPTQKLDVIGTGLFRNGNTNAAFDNNQILFGYAGNATYKHAIKTRHNSLGAAGNSIDFYLWDYGTGTPPTDATIVGTKHIMTLDGNGNVGIGTANPGANLHVVNSGTATNTVAQFLTPALATTNATYLKLGKALSSGDQADIVYNWTGANNAANYLGFSFYGGSIHMAVTNAGNVGIGTVGPSSKLDVNGAANFSSGIYYNTAGAATPNTSPLNVELTRNLPNVVGNTVEIGNMAIYAGAHNVRISVSVSNNGFSESQMYLIPIGYGGTGGVWQQVTPVATSGPYGGNDFALDVNVNTNVATFRLRRTAGTTDGSIGAVGAETGATVRIESVGSTRVVFTPTTTTGSATVPAAAYGNSTDVTPNYQGYVPNMTSNAGDYRGITVSASSEFSASYRAYAPMSGAIADWATAGVNSNFWIQVQFPVKTPVNRIAMRGRASGNEGPTSEIIQGSNDGSTWTTLGSYTVNTNTATPTMFSFPTAYYTHYRITFPTATGTNAGLCFLQFYRY